MATVIKRGNRWRAQIRCKGRSISRTFGHRRDAQLWASDQERGIVAGRGGGGTGRGWYLRDLIHRYLQDLPRLGVRDERSKRTQLAWWNAAYGHVKLVDVVPALLGEARDKLLRDPTHRGTARTGATVNRYLSALGGALKCGVRRYHCLDRNPLADVQKEVESPDAGRALNVDEIKLLLKAIPDNDPELRCVVTFAITTCARRGEIEKLVWSDVDLAAGIVRFTQTKNGRSRSVPLPPATVAALREWQRLTGHIGGSRTFIGCGDWLYRRTTQAATRAGLGDLRFHDLRHTGLTLLARNGATLSEIAAIAGHRTLQMVARYSHLSESAPRGAADRAAASAFG